MSELISYDAARAAIEQAQSLGELKDIRDQAQAYRHYIKAATKSKALADQFAEIRLRAERRAGELLRDNPCIHRGGDQLKPNSHRESLVDLGVSHNQSHRWQKIACVPEDVFDDYLSYHNRLRFCFDAITERKSSQ